PPRAPPGPRRQTRPPSGGPVPPTPRHVALVLLPVASIAVASAPPASAAPAILREAFRRPAHAQAGAPIAFLAQGLAGTVPISFTKKSGGTVEATPVTLHADRGFLLTHVPGDARDANAAVPADGPAPAPLY